MMKPAVTKIMIEKGDTYVIIENIPSERYDLHDMDYFSNEVSRQIMALAEEAAKTGYKVVVVDFAKAATPAA
jgi:uroporphyrinogen-III decarboxylase